MAETVDSDMHLLHFLAVGLKSGQSMKALFSRDLSVMVGFRWSDYLYLLLGCG
jgi:hypothetical protein